MIYYVFHNDSYPLGEHYHHVRLGLSLGPAVFEIPDDAIEIGDYEYTMLSSDMALLRACRELGITSLE